MWMCQVVAPSDRGQGGTTTLEGVPVHRMRYAAPEHETLAYTGTMTEALRSPRGLRALASMTSTLRSEASRLALASHAPVVMHALVGAGGMSVPRDVRTVVTCHGTDVRLLSRGGVFQWLGARVLRRAAVVTTVSRPLARVIRRALRRGDSRRPYPADAGARQPRPISDRTWRDRDSGPAHAAETRGPRHSRIRCPACPGYAPPLTVVAMAPRRATWCRRSRTRGLRPGAVCRRRASRPEVFAHAECRRCAHDEGLGLVARRGIDAGRAGGRMHRRWRGADVVPADGGGRVVAPDADAIADASMGSLAVRRGRDRSGRSGRTWANQLSQPCRRSRGDMVSASDRCVSVGARAAGGGGGRHHRACHSERVDAIGQRPRRLGGVAPPLRHDRRIAWHDLGDVPVPAHSRLARGAADLGRALYACRRSRSGSSRHGKYIPASSGHLPRWRSWPSGRASAGAAATASSIVMQMVSITTGVAVALALLGAEVVAGSTSLGLTGVAVLAVDAAGRRWSHYAR